jgi:3-dehydroquinate synthase
VLNFGHTIGHALESYRLDIGAPISHGHAVALGMHTEMRIATLRAEWAMVLGRLIKRHYDMEPIEEVSIATLMPYMLNDKKRNGDDVLLALPGEDEFTLQDFRAF